jgi:hypothetical protein
VRRKPPFTWLKAGSTRRHSQKSPEASAVMDWRCPQTMLLIMKKLNAMSEFPSGFQVVEINKVIFSS